MNESAAIIKERVSAREAARHYGLPFDRQGWACCPFHHETQPSLRLYEGKGGWHCFGCGKGGSVIDLVMQLEGIAFPQAVARIDHDFHLGLPGNGRKSALERAKWREQEKARRKAHAAAQAQYEAARAVWERSFDWWFSLSRMAFWLRPLRPGDETTDLFADVIWELPIALDAVTRDRDAMLEAENKVKEYAGIHV